MEVVVEAASEVPTGCFISVRLGENLKQRRFAASSAKHHFPLPEEKRKARIDVYQLLGTCSVNVDPASTDSNEVSVVSDALPTMKLRVTTSSKAADVAKQRQDVEAEAKDAAQGYLAKHGIEQKLSECLRTMLRMKPTDPIEFMRKYLKESNTTAPAVATAVPDSPAPELSSVPFALRPSVGTWYQPIVEDPTAIQPFALEEDTPESLPPGAWRPPANFQIQGLGNSVHECNEVERVLTKALLEMDGCLKGDYFALSPHPLKPDGLTDEETSMLKAKKLFFETAEPRGRGVYLTETGDIALLLNAKKHLQVLAKSKEQIDTVTAERSSDFNVHRPWSEESLRSKLQKQVAMWQPRDRQVQSFNDPFGGELMPFGRPGGFGGLFGSMFGQMNQMMQEMDQMMNHQIEHRGPNMSMMSGNMPGGSFSCQTFAFSSRTGPDGQMHTEQYASSAVGDRGRDMHEVQQMYSNSSGVDKMSLERQLEGRARKMVKERTRSTMEERQTEMFRGMEEADASDFDRHWQERAAPHLPQHQGFNRMLGGPSMGRGSQAISGGYQPYPSQPALPFGYPDHARTVQGTPLCPERPMWR